MSIQTLQSSYCTLVQAGAILNVTRQNVWSLCRRGMLPYTFMDSEVKRRGPKKIIAIPERSVWERKRAIESKRLGLYDRQRYITATEAAEILGKTRPRVHQLMSEGLLEGVLDDIHGRLFTRESVEKYATAHRA